MKNSYGQQVGRVSVVVDKIENGDFSFIDDASIQRMQVELNLEAVQSLSAKPAVISPPNLEKLALDTCAALTGISARLNRTIKNAIIECGERKSSGVSQSDAHMFVDLWGKQFTANQLLLDTAGLMDREERSRNVEVQLDTLVRTLEQLLSEQFMHLSKMVGVAEQIPLVEWCFARIRAIKELFSGSGPFGLTKLVTAQ